MYRAPAASAPINEYRTNSHHKGTKEVASLFNPVNRQGLLLINFPSWPKCLERITASTTDMYTGKTLLPQRDILSSDNIHPFYVEAVTHSVECPLLQDTHNSVLLKAVKSTTPCWRCQDWPTPQPAQRMYSGHTPPHNTTICNTETDFPRFDDHSRPSGQNKDTLRPQTALCSIGGRECQQLCKSRGELFTLQNQKYSRGRHLQWPTRAGAWLSPYNIQNTEFLYFFICQFLWFFIC